MSEAPDIRLIFSSHSSVRSRLKPRRRDTKRRVTATAVTYSICRLSEAISPIKTVPLSRHRKKDANMIKKLPPRGGRFGHVPRGNDLQGAILAQIQLSLRRTYRPNLAMSNKMTMFYGTTATGWKGMDPFYFFMDPSPTYEVTFLSQLPKPLTCTGGKTNHEVPNYIQKLLAGTLSFTCTNFTRKDKYRVLAGNDGVFPLKSVKSGSWGTGG